ncbi:MAG: hypothetical protein EOP51_04745 [Sphingobacteriales bacterium]|nr:MAG: hypothetical protein EOP51_04745 [Sphingobacteriales bacterium]
MQELINIMQQKAGISEAQAVKALEAVTDYIKGQLPPMMHGMIDNFIQQNETEQDEDVLNGSGEGNWSDDADIDEFEEEKPGEFSKQTGEKFNEWADKAENIAKDTFGKLKSMMKDKDQEL